MVELIIILQNVKREVIQLVFSTEQCESESVDFIEMCFMISNDYVKPAMIELFFDSYGT